MIEKLNLSDKNTPKFTLKEFNFYMILVNQIELLIIYFRCSPFKINNFNINLTKNGQ